MRICIFGAGAIGAYVGACLARAGRDVTLVARGPHLAAMRANGVRVREYPGLEDFEARPACAAAEEVGPPPDLLLLTLKGHQIAPALPAIRPLLGPDTLVAVAVNGIPFWYFHGLEGPWAGRPVETVDPGGALLREIGPERVLGTVIKLGVEAVEPGILKHTSPYATLYMGEPAGGVTDRLRAVHAALQAGGIEAPACENIRDEIWNKLLVNLCFNPISALTESASDALGGDAGIRTLVDRMMTEARAVAGALGARITIDMEERLAKLATNPPQITSMLQDLRLGRPMEIDGIVTAVLELAETVGVDAPIIQTVHALVTRRARAAGLYPAS